MNKNLFFSLTCVVLSHIGLQAQVVNFADINFRLALVNTFCVDTNNDGAPDADADLSNDGQIQLAEAQAVKSLNVSAHNIESLQGIEHFVALERLVCTDNALDTLDVSMLTNLNNLSCSYNTISHLNIDGLNLLTQLRCRNNLLDTLRTDGFGVLRYLDCRDNQLTTLSMLGNNNLRELYCANNLLTSLDLQEFVLLENVDCDQNQLHTLVVQGLTNLDQLTCRNNVLTSLNLLGLTNLIYVSCINNELTSLQIQGLSNLKYLQCSNNELDSLPLQGVDNLLDLFCYNNNLQNLDVQHLQLLRLLSCNNNQLSTLQLQGLDSLSIVYCENNQLTAINVAGAHILETFYCSNNLLTTLNVQDQPILESFYCNNNKLVTLYVNNGIQEQNFGFFGNPTLLYVCCDPMQLNDIYNKILQYGFINCVVNAACSYNIAFLQGIIAHDENLNCLYDTLELGMVRRVIKAEKAGEEPFYAISNHAGQFEMGIDTGNYKVSTYLLNNYSLPCEDTLLVSLPTLHQTANIEFPFETTIACPLLEVNIASNRMRRCFDNQYYVQYCNTGTATAPDAQVTVTLSNDVALLGSSIAGTPLGGNKWRFSIGDVQPEHCGNFSIDFHVICDSTELGQVITATAHITPDSICTPPDSDWSGAQVMVDGFCEGDSVRFSIKNIGFGDMTQERQYFVIEDDVILYQGTYDLNAQDFIHIKYPANGSTWHLEAQQEPTFPFVSMPSASVEGCGLNLGGLASLGFVTQYSELDGNPFYSRESREATSAYDPNDKIAWPQGYGPDHHIRPNTDLTYHINFQNTGNDTAFTVVIIDTLDAALDPTTFRAGMSSHLYDVQMYGHGVLKFTFNNIMLPDSNINEAASHGFVRFRIMPKNPIPLGTRIENRAGIYFDFNLPIITNTVFHTVDTGFIATVPVIDIAPIEPMRIHPNPVRAGEYLYFDHNDPTQRIILYDPLGRIAFASLLSSNKLHIPAHLPPGVYYLVSVGERGERRRALVSVR